MFESNHDNLSPIVVFVYRRLDETIKTLESLKKNTLAKCSDLYIFSDGWKNDNDQLLVESVRSYIKSLEGFKSVNIILSPLNKGLANSVIYGVTEIINRYGKVIVVEDDLTTSSDFLEYMNDALDYFQADDRIWSITGYSPKYFEKLKKDKDIYFTPRACSYGWATWINRWETIDWQVKDFDQLKYNKTLKKQFEQGGNDMYRMLEAQMLGKIDSWAIRWCYAQFRLNAYTVYPYLSKVNNIGFSGLATHGALDPQKWLSNANQGKVQLHPFELEPYILKEYKRYQDMSLKTRVGYFLRKFGGYKTIKKFYVKFFSK